jgi:hypothetical protein
MTMGGKKVMTRERRSKGKDGWKSILYFFDLAGFEKVGGFHFLVHPQWFTENSHFINFCKVGGVGNNLSYPLSPQIFYSLLLLSSSSLFLTIGFAMAPASDTNYT